MDKIVLSVLPAIMVILFGATSAHALTSEQRSSVGFQDGLSDCATGTSAKINGASNAGHHTQAYMQGYKEGLNSCTANTNLVTQNQAQYQNQNPNYSCFTLIGDCGAQNSAQSEDQGQ
jgi:hypothetical protein